MTDDEVFGVFADIAAGLMPAEGLEPTRRYVAGAFGARDRALRELEQWKAVSDVIEASRDAAVRMGERVSRLLALVVAELGPIDGDFDVSQLPDRVAAVVAERDRLRFACAQIGTVLETVALDEQVDIPPATARDIVSRCYAAIGDVAPGGTSGEGT